MTSRCVARVCQHQLSFLLVFTIHASQCLRYLGCNIIHTYGSANKGLSKTKRNDGTAISSTRARQPMEQQPNTRRDDMGKTIDLEQRQFKPYA